MVMKLSSCACLLPLACSLLPSALAEGFNGSLDFEQRINGKTFPAWRRRRNRSENH